MTKRVLLLWIVLSSFLLSDTQRSIPLKELFQTKLTLKEKVFELWLSVNPKQKKEGLSFLLADEVPSYKGMLFIYPMNEKLSFWMKNTYLDLDLAYIDEEGRVRDIFSMTKDTSIKFHSSVKVRYALELKAGEFKKIGLKVGDKVEFSSLIKGLSKP